jgi:hypothetical protein
MLTFIHPRNFTTSTYLSNQVCYTGVRERKEEIWGHANKPLNVCTFKVIKTNKCHEVNKGASIVFSNNGFGKTLLLKMAPSMFATCSFI